MEPSDSLGKMRKEYQLETLSENDVDPDPVKQFEHWWHEAIAAGIAEPNAMTLATCTSSGKPSARIVLLKDIHENGLVFFTNYQSRKAKEIEENNFVSLLFFWEELERQVRIEGIAQKVSAEESDAYFASRPRESQIGARCSPQSSVIENRKVLMERQNTLAAKYQGKTIPRPDYWGGYLVKPQIMEYWQGRPGRLHDRIQYIQRNAEWSVQRLAP